MDNRASSEENFEHIQEASENPEKYTTSQPNGSVKPAFFTTSTKGAGKDGLKAGPKTFYYEVQEPKDVNSSSSSPAVSALLIFWSIEPSPPPSNVRSTV